MDARNREELLKKQESLEAYLLENPKSTLFAWYARQNMEAGELDRALSICKLGVQNVDRRGVLHKLMGEIYLAKGEVTQSMKHLVECILTKEPFPGVIIEVVKNLGDTMEAEQIAFLVHLLNKALPGHPDATRFYKKYPSARNHTIQPGQYKFLEEIVANFERSALVEVMSVDDEDEEPLAIAANTESLEPLPEVTPVPAPEPVPTPEPVPDPYAAPTVDITPEFEKPAAVPEYEIPDSTPPLNELVATPEPLPEPAEPPKPVERPAPRQGPAVKHNITRSMATFTLMQIFKDQGMYDNALEVLLFLREKSSNTERIENEEREIRDLMARNGIK